MIRDYIQQEISDMFKDFETLIDIKDLQKKLITEFTTRSLVKTFRNNNVHPPRKQPSVNNTNVKENKDASKEQVDAYNEEWDSRRQNG